MSKQRESWRPDLAGVAACLVVAGMFGLSAVGFLLLCMVVAAFHGWTQGTRARKEEHDAS